MHTHELLAIAAAIVPDRTALSAEGVRTTYAGLAARANRLANALAEAGVGAGDRVAVMDVNTSQHFEVYFAAARLDAIYVPLNFRGSGHEVAYPLEHAVPKVVVAGQRYAGIIDGLTGRAEHCIVVGPRRADRMDCVRGVRVDGLGGGAPVPSGRAGRDGGAAVHRGHHR